MNAVHVVTHLEDGLAALLAYACRGVVQVRTASGFGTGVVWRADPEVVEVVTNAHVVREARQGVVQVVTHDRQQEVARVAIFKPEVDLALLRIEHPHELDAQAVLALPFDTDGRPRVGELVFAIGNPRGEPHVITMGVLSAWSEALAGGRRIPVLRSDVLLAPGNSGGPLLNARGSVIGINALIVGGDQSVSIPATVVCEALDLRRWHTKPTMRAA